MMDLETRGELIKLAARIRDAMLSEWIEDYPKTTPMSVIKSVVKSNGKFRDIIYEINQIARKKEVKVETQEKA